MPLLWTPLLLASNAMPPSSDLGNYLAGIHIHSIQYMTEFSFYFSSNASVLGSTTIYKSSERSMQLSARILTCSPVEQGISLGCFSKYTLSWKREVFKILRNTVMHSVPLKVMSSSKHFSAPAFLKCLTYSKIRHLLDICIYYIQGAFHVGVFWKLWLEIAGEAIKSRLYLFSLSCHSW